MADETPGRDSRDTARIIAALVILGVLVAFVLANLRKVKVGFVFTDVKVPLIFVLIGTAIIGAILDRLVQYVVRRRH
jgi:uncharacterized integral membrane protein